MSLADLNYHWKCKSDPLSQPVLSPNFPGKYPNFPGKYEPNLLEDVEKFPPQRRIVRLLLSEELGT
jgi:hypothetical protein